MYAIGQSLIYLYKQAGEEFTVNAIVTDVSPNGKRIEIEFTHPNGRTQQGGYKHRRTLRLPENGNRIVSQEKAQEKTWGGKRAGAGPKRQYIKISLHDLPPEHRAWLAEIERYQSQKKPD